MIKSFLRYQRKTVRKWVILTSLLLVFINKGIAGVDPPVIKTLNGSLGQVAVDSFVMVEDAKFFDPAYASKLVALYPLRNIITVEINEDVHTVLQSNFSATVRLEIRYVLNDNTTGTQQRNFTVNYDGGSSYAQKDVYIFSNCARVEIEVIQLTKNVGWDVWSVIKVTNQLQSLPNYNFYCDSNAIKIVNDSAWAPNTDKDELPVYWSPSIGADEYDLEWTYIDSSALASGRYGPDPDEPDPDLIFDNNSSRVTITGTSYNIPLIYDNKGHLFFRVRSVQWQPGGGRNETYWSSDYTPNGLGRFDYNGHERSLNWQATTTYAEEGKRKVVIQYFDGSLRGRQTVTKDNSTNTVVVAESFYDYQGRPVVQVLPAPTMNSIIKYNTSFNVGLNSNVYDKFNYDSLPDANAYCAAGAAAMDTVSGAARYYSPNNPLIDSGFHKYIPDAAGFPFSEVEYTQDNTGRVSRQSGVGEKFRIGGGYETKYFYGTADQRELDALFGTEVGEESHYFKTMVRDANGQYSVSYTDMHGRTIATALAGAPDNAKLDTLSSYVSAVRTERISSPEATVIKDLVMENKKSIVVTRPDNYTFTYKLDHRALQAEDCNETPVCYNCLYDLQITISGDCNNQNFGGVPFDTVVRNFNIVEIDTSCNDTTGFNFTFTKWLEEGSYEITKKLSVSKYGLDYYRDSFFLAANSCKTIDTFLNEQRALRVGIIDCNPTCESCMESVGEWPEFWERYRETTGIEDKDTAVYKNGAMAAYEQAKEDCAILCDSLQSEYNDIRQSMLMDMTPSGGQYANADNEEDIYSIFFSSADGISPDTAARYQKITNYVDEDGNPDKVYDESSGTLVTPDQLSPEVFVQKFKLSWAKSLLPYHPEYCKLVYYDDSLRNSNLWDRRFAAVNTYAEAMERGYLNPTNSNDAPFSNFTGTGTIDPDPMASYAGGHFLGRLRDSLTKFRKVNDSLRSMWTFACISVMCGATDFTCYGKFYGINHAFNPSDMCEGERDMAWRVFRQMYLDIKRNIQNTWLKTKCPATPSAVTLMAAEHHPHFTDAREMLTALDFDLPNDTTGVKAAYQQQTNNYYLSNCVSYATQWWNQLAPCNFSAGDSARVVSRLVQICYEGSDSYHPYGSSSTKPGSSLTWDSFEEFLEFYCDSVGIDYNAHCNAFLIPAPKAYDRQVINSNKAVYGRPDSCECDAIATYYEKYEASAGYASFADYMNRVHGTSMSMSELNTLLGYCQIAGSTPTCSLQSDPIYLPPAFQCYTGDICVGCEQVKTLDEEFRSKFPDGYPTSGNISLTDSAQIRISRLYENFMNSRLGFAKSTGEYLGFIDQCSQLTFVDTTGITCSELSRLVNLFYFTYINPASGTVDLDMRTFAGNKTPREGPKGVFDVNGDLIGQTISGTPAQIDSSYADIWNSSPANQAVGTLEPLANGRFRLQLESGQQAPCNGIIGMRYYQFDTHVKDTMRRIGTSIGSYIDFGDSTTFSVGTDATNSHTFVSRSNGVFNYYQVKKVLGNDYTAYTQFLLTHYYPSTPYRTTYTVTVYHTDTIGNINFFDARPNGDSTQFSNLRGYFPQHLLEIRFGGTRDSTINRTREIKNFEQISSIQYVECRINTPAVGQTPAPFLFNNLGSFANNHGLRYFRLDPDYEFIPNYEDPGVVDAVAGKHWYETFPDFNINFPDVRFIYIAGWDKREDDISYFNFELPKLRVAEMAFFELPSGFTDSFYNQVARVTQVDSPAHIAFGSSMFAIPTAASSAARDYLISQGWKINHDGFHMGSIGQGTLDLVATDSIPKVNAFTEYFNQRFGTSFIWQDLKDFFISKCGSAPDFCTYQSLDSLVWIRDQFKNNYFNFGRKYDVNGCDTMTWRINYPSTFTGYPVSYQEAFANGVMQFPDTLGINGTPTSTNYDFVWRDTACVERRFALEFRMRQDHFRRFVTEMWFMDKQETPRKFYIVIDSPNVSSNLAAFYDWGPIENNREYFGVSEFRQDYSTWRVLKFQVIDSVLKFYLDGTLMKTLNFPSTLPVYKFYGFGFASRGPVGTMAAEIDYVKCYDKNDSVFYYDDFSDCVTRPLFEDFIRCPKQPCSEAFTEFFNDIRNTEYSYADIQNLYLERNIPLNVCDSSLQYLTLCGRAEPVFGVVAMDSIDNCSDSTFFIQSAAQELYKLYVDSLKNHFDSSYIAKCLEAYKFENFTVRHAVSEYHHTLYYYDQAGNLIKTVPPAGVHANYDSLWLDSVYTARLAGLSKTPDHTLVTQYRYNTLNQVVAQKSPDGGLTEFWYDRLGRLALSRNAKQLAASSSTNHFFSYTRYDDLGRITEVGQLRDTATATAVSDALTRHESNFSNWFNLRTHYRHQVTQTVYDTAYWTGPYNPLTLYQRNLRNRVSFVALYDTTGASVAYNNAVFYTYDILGNVDTLLNDYGFGSGATSLWNVMNRNGNRWKKIVYNYDLISGKVNTVAYQRGYTDQFFQRYIYDAENRLILAESSRDSAVWQTEARYEYYKHGPLARLVLGQQQVQGVDYAYTLQGWLKGINSTGGTATHDMGGDGLAASVHQYTARDAIGVTLNYFAGEYAPINSGVNPFPGYSAFLGSNYKPLFNGNISSSSVYNKRLGDVGAEGGAMLFYNYRYDQLNRLTGMDVYNGFDAGGNDWNDMQLAMNNGQNRMKENVSYDANGNILTYRRVGANGHTMDKLQYSYYPGTNQLKRITDTVPDNTFPGFDILYDIDNQTDANNYVYDAIGNLIQDKKEQINSIKWNVYGKITDITRNSTGGVPVTTIKYFYDALGNRIGKVFDLGGTKKYTWYVRDAQGNVLSIYGVDGNDSLHKLELYQLEQYLYGSSRLGMHANSQQVDNITAGPGTMQFYTGGQMFRGRRHYELTNHLGNVLAVVTDKKIGVSSGGSLNDYYNADIYNATDYYPFGMASRVTIKLSNDTRFGFNGKEFDWEVKGWQNQLSFGDRIYDPRSGRWLGPDPITKPDVSPYQFGKNNPVNFIDPDGADEIHFIFTTTRYSQKNILGRNQEIKIVIVPKEGPDRFFHHQVDRVMSKKEEVIKGGSSLGLDAVKSSWVQSSIKDKVTEFFPNATWGESGGPFRGTGVTQSDGAFPLMKRNDEDRITLWKLTTPELSEYLAKKDPDKYGDLAMGSVGMKIGEAGRAIAGAALLFEGGVSLRRPASSSGFTVNSTGQGVLPMSVTRIIKQGEKIDDIVNEVKGLTWVTGNEHAVVRLASGKKAIVSGGPGGIFFKEGQIKTLFGHSHPYPGAPPSAADIKALDQLDQSKQYLLSNGVIEPIKRATSN